MHDLKVGMVSFFVPCLNEEGNVGRAIDTVVGVMADIKAFYEIIIVDDASTDGTVASVLQCQGKYPNVNFKLVRNKFCRGLGRNYFIAAQRASGEYFMLINGDAAEPSETIHAIVSQMGKADAVVPYFGVQESRTWARRLLSRTFTFLVNLISGNKLHYYNGPVLHKTDNVRSWFAETAGFGYQAELLCRLLGEGISVIEVQVANSDRERGASKALRFSNVLSVSNSLFHIFLRRFESASIRILPSPIEEEEKHQESPVASESVGVWRDNHG
jgi:glycosyltransferase involved in cell wall biosynthesis